MDGFAEIIHGLKAPIANIKLTIALLGAKDDRNQKYLDLIAFECDRQIVLINDLLLAEQIKEWEVVKRPILLRFWFYRLIEQHKSLLTSRSLEVEIQIDRRLKIVSDPKAMEVVFLELLHNACKYTPTGGTIKIAADRHCITIANPGSIPENEIPRLFDRFYRVPGGDPHRQGGSGLGLAIVKQLAEKLGYSIACHCIDGMVAFEVCLDRSH